MKRGDSEQLHRARESQLDDPIFQARLTHEGLIAWFALATAVIGIIIVTWRIATVEAPSGWWILAVAVVGAVVYAFSLADRHRSQTWKCWARAAFEVTGPTVILLLDWKAGPEFVLSSSTPYIYLLAVILGCLRLRPFLSICAALLAVTQQGLIFGVVIAQLPDGVASGRIKQELMFRLAILTLAGLIGTMLARNLRHQIRGAAEEERVRSAFGSYVDSRVVKRVLEGDLTVAPERREVTIMFVDIRGFTQFSETTDPAKVFQILTRTLEAFSIEVQKQGGLVNKFLGDGMLAIFGAPELQEDHVRRSVRAALMIARAARDRAADGSFPGLRIGIGIHTGDAVVGDLGGFRREYTAIGDVVNVAARVEAANKELGTTILVTEAVCRQLDGLTIRNRGTAALRGRAESIELFEVEDLDPSLETLTRLSKDQRPPAST